MLQNRWYDIYLPKYNAIIEINGIQHYEPTKNLNREQKSAEQQYLECISSDKLKYDTAIKKWINVLCHRCKKSKQFI